MIYIKNMDLGRMWSSNKPINNIIIRKPKIIKPKIKPKVNKISESKPDSRAYWGTPTWILFHTIAEKIDSNFYVNNYEYIWNFIKRICQNLPCPFCKNHAISYTNKISLNQVRTKEGLKLVLFNFHNYVNKSSNKSELDIGILNKYKLAKVNNVFTHFQNRFFISYLGTRQFTDWIKNALKEDFKEFWRKLDKFM